MPPPEKDQTRWFAEQVQPHEGGLRRYLHGFASPCDIDDLVQEAYVRMFKIRERGAIGSPRGLLFAVARNLARDLFRHASATHAFDVTEIDDLPVLDDRPGVVETVCRRQDADLLAAAIDALPARCRQVLMLRKFENLSHREIARRLGIAEHTVEAQLTKALHRCEDFFAKHGALPS